MLLLITVVVGIGLALLTCEYWHRLFGAESVLGHVSFSRWVGTGLIGPGVVWMFLNCGFFSALPPLLPEIAMAQSSGGNWVPLLLRQAGPGLMVIATYWAAVTFVHLAVVIGVHGESRLEFAIVTVVIAVLMSPLFWLLGRNGGLAWAGTAVLFWLVPVTHCTASLASRSKPAPIYARAVARMKLGKYQEAETEVIRQLEVCEEDFEGWMMLAELYATQFNDLSEADRTVRAVCRQPNATPLQVSLAYHRLADWHLKLGDDPVAAKRALEEIPQRLPGTHFARMAQQRAQQLPASRQELLEQKKARTIRLPALGGDLDAPVEREGPRLSRRDAAELANECVQRLKENPDNPAPREKLAFLCVDELNKVDLGIEQLRLLIDMPGQPENKRAEWLSSLAAWEFRHRRDRVAAKAVLSRLIREHPQSAQGFAAQRWLNLLEMEERSFQAKSGAMK